MANIIQGPNTFTIDEWHSSNHAKLSRAEVQRSSAKNLIAKTQQVISERQEQTDKGQRDVEQKLNLRIDNVKILGWRNWFKSNDLGSLIFPKNPPTPLPQILAL